MNVNTIRKMKRGFSLMIVAGAACLAGTFAMPNNASASGHGSETGAFNSGSSPINVVTDFSTATLACVSRSTMLTMMGYDPGHGNVANNVQVCHTPPGYPPEAKHTVIVDQHSVSALVAQGDTPGLCPNWVSQSYLEVLPGCSSVDSSGNAVDGVWIPAPNNAPAYPASLNAYFAQVQSGSIPGHPGTSSRSYREIGGQ